MEPDSKKLRVAVLFGGPSAEHEVSLKSGAVVLQALDKQKYEPVKILITKQGTWALTPQELKTKADVAFGAHHGTYGEDGTVQDILEKEGMPYTGTGPRESAFAMNKFLSIQHFKDKGL